MISLVEIWKKKKIFVRILTEAAISHAQCVVVSTTGQYQYSITNPSISCIGFEFSEIITHTHILFIRHWCISRSIGIERDFATYREKRIKKHIIRHDASTVPDRPVRVELLALLLTIPKPGNELFVLAR